MDKSKKLIAGVIGVLSIVATTSMATPAYAAKGADLVNRGTTKVYSGATTQSTTSSKGNISVSSQTVDTRASQPSALSYGWNVIGNNPDKIMFKDESGNVIKNQWYKSVGSYGWKYFDANGYLKRSAWIQDSGKWYYLDINGTMVTDVFVDGYYVDKSGAYSTVVRPVIDSYGIGTYKGGFVLDSSNVNNAKNIEMSASEFESKVASGEIKAKVTYSKSTGGASSGLNSGNVDFYLTK